MPGGLIGGPFFDVDIALGKPVCLTVAGSGGRPA
jgi:hypothetical protein